MIVTKGLFLVLILSVVVDVSSAADKICHYAEMAYYYKVVDLADAKFNKIDTTAFPDYKAVCSADDTCKYVVYNGDETYWINATTFTEMFVATKDADNTNVYYGRKKLDNQCYNVEDYKFADAATVSDSCPSDIRKVACIYSPDATTEGECYTTDDQCCWDANASEKKCHMSSKYQCAVPTSALYSGVSTLETVDDNNVFPGESVTFTCNANMYFKGNNAVDSNQKTVLNCARGTDDKVTDLTSTWNAITCTAYCTKITYNAATAEVSTTFPARPYSDITVKCKDGYGLAGGSTQVAVSCTDDGEAEECKRCTAPADYTNSTFDPAHVIPTQQLKQTCSDGYSIESTKATERTFSCNDGALSPTPVDCIENCPLAVGATHEIAEEAGKYDGKRITYGSSVSIKCKAGSGALPVSQAATVSCSTAGESITLKACEPVCLTSGLIVENERNIMFTTGAYLGTTSEVPAETALKIVCQSNKALELGVSEEFTCSSDFYKNNKFVIADCYKKCAVSPNANIDTFHLLDDKNQLGNALGSGDMAVKGTKVRATCKSGMTVVGKAVSTQDFECGEKGEAINPTPCAAPCLLSELTGVTSNTDVTPAGDHVGAGQGVTFKCPSSDYELGSGAFNVDNGKNVQCAMSTSDNTKYEIKPKAVPAASNCFGKPTLSGAQNEGQGSLKITVSVPSNFDKTNSPINEASLKLSKSSTVLQTKTLSASEISTLQSSASLQISFDVTQGEAGELTVLASVKYTSANVEKTVSLGGLQFGPAALATAPTFSATGRKNILIKYGTSTAYSNSAITGYSSLTFKIEFMESGSSDVVKKLENVAYTSFADSTTTPTVVDGLKEATTYDIKITSVVAAGYGGSKSAAAMSTGYDSPIVSESVVDSTTNKLTITLANSVAYNGNLKVSINGVEEDLTFTNGVATKTLSGLTAKKEYTYPVIVKSAAGVASDTTTVTFTQGPTEPVFGAASKTHTSITATWTPVQQNTYYVSLNYANGTEAVAQVNTTQGSYVFSGLSAGTDYKVVAKAEMAISGSVMSSGTITSAAIKTYDCTVLAKSTNYQLYKWSSGKKGPKVAADYLYADANTEFFVECPTNHSFVVLDLGTIDNITSCIGPNTWSYHSDCSENAVTDEVASASQAGVIVGIIIAVVLILIIIIVIIVLIKRNKRKGSESRSKKYSPRDEEKNNEKEEGGEAWRNPYYTDTDEKGSPDIPDNRDAANGDNVSQDPERQ